MPETVDIASVCAYLTFAGNCREAMTFYRDCLGGTVTFVTLNQSPMAEHLPAAQGKYILLAQLKHPQLRLMATDIAPDEGLVQGNVVALYLHCASLRQMEKLYAALSQKGEETAPVHQTFFGEWFANLTDQFGVRWILYCAPPNILS
jgi:PhnB protein